VAEIKEKKQANEMVYWQGLCLDSTEANKHLACHSMHPNHLFGDDLEIRQSKPRRRQVGWRHYEDMGVYFSVNNCFMAAQPYVPR